MRLKQAQEKCRTLGAQGTRRGEAATGVMGQLSSSEVPFS